MAASPAPFDTQKQEMIENELQKIEQREKTPGATPQLAVDGQEPNEMRDSLELPGNSDAAAAAVRNTSAADTFVSLLPTDIRGMRDQIDDAEWSIWRYRAALPFAQDSGDWRTITLGEGATPLIDARSDLPGLKLKVEYAMPTLSFKDRGSAVMVAKAREWGVDRMAADSSGNAGVALAAYAARAGISCEVFVPASASASKLTQIEMHGARVHRVDGPRQAATDAAREFVDARGVFYASHILNPFFHEGTKTFAYEIWEQLGFRAPDHVILPVGHGTLVLGACKGFQELLNAGYIERMPSIHAVQAAACAPIAEAFSKGKQNVSVVMDAGTEAEGIAITNPLRGAQILRAVRRSDGDVVALTDEKVRQARRELASMGYFVEPTAAVPFAAYRHVYQTQFARGSVIVVPLCGAGLKTPYLL